MSIGSRLGKHKRTRPSFHAHLGVQHSFNLIVLVACTLLTGCNDIGSGPPTDDDIIRTAYSTYRLPEGFLTENFSTGSPYYENTISVRPLKERGNTWIELSTNDYNQALAWSEASSRNSAYYRELVSQRETERFFEFRRVYTLHPSDAILSRIHKATYLDRSEFDRLNEGAVLGRFQVRPVTKQNVKELIEYLWYVNNYAFGKKVLNTSVNEDASHVDYALQELDVAYGDWGIRDEIIVTNASYRVDKVSGLISYTHKVVRTIEGLPR